MKHAVLVIFGFALALNQVNSYTNENILHHREKRFLFSGHDPEIDMTGSQMIRYQGYPVEDHTVTTDDQYILNLQRIPYGRNSAGPSSNNKLPVLLQHGLVDASITFYNNFPLESLAFILADAGYDVWLGNIRGDTYSKGHLKYSVNSDDFWDFSFEEMAKYDLPTFVNYILKTTGKKKLHYIGHSQGTMIGFIEFSRNKDLQSKIQQFIALAPVTHIDGIKGAMSYVAKYISYIGSFLGVREFSASTFLTKFIAKFICNNWIGGTLCSNAIFMITGWSNDNINTTRMPVYTAHYPAGTSMKNVRHYAQLLTSGKFQKYDYGWFKNLFHYGSLGSPPEYDISNINIPVALFIGGNDWLAPPTNIAKYIRPQLNNISLDVMINNYNHIDFVWGVNAHTKVYPKILNLMKKYA